MKVILKEGEVRQGSIPAVISRSHSWKCRQINVLNPRLKKMPVYFETGSISVLQTGSRSRMRV